MMRIHYGILLYVQKKNPNRTQYLVFQNAQKLFFIFWLQSVSFSMENSHCAVVDSPTLPICHMLPEKIRRRKSKQSVCSRKSQNCHDYIIYNVGMPIFCTVLLHLHFLTISTVHQPLLPIITIPILYTLQRFLTQRLHTSA